MLLVLLEPASIGACCADHGAFNSWGRQPFVTDILNGTLSAQPAYSRLHHSLIVANYAADGCEFPVDRLSCDHERTTLCLPCRGCFDNDDGSSYFLEESNFCVFGGVRL